MTWVFNASAQQEHESNYPAIVAVCAITTVLATVVTFARLQRRWSQRGWDDWWSLLSLVFSIIYNGFTLGQTRWGLALPPTDRPAANSYNYTVVNFWSRPFYLAGLACFKVALCIGSLRLVENSDLHTFRKVVTFGAWASGLIQLIFIGLELGNCTPFKKNFHSEVPGYCMPFAPVNWTISIVTVLNDCFVFVHPVWLVRRLKLHRSQKIRLYIGFLLGFVTTVFSILRMAYIPNIVNGNGDSTMLVFFGNVEMNLGTISASLVFLMRPIVECLGRVKETSGLGLSKHSAGGVGTYKLESLNPETRYTEHQTTATRSVSAYRQDEDAESQKNMLVRQEKWDGLVRTLRVTVRSETGERLPEHDRTPSDSPKMPASMA